MDRILRPGRFVAKFMVALCASTWFVLDLFQQLSDDFHNVFRINALYRFHTARLMNFLTYLVLHLRPYTHDHARIFFALVCLVYAHVDANGFDRPIEWFEVRGFVDVTIVLIYKIEAQFLWVSAELLRHHSNRIDNFRDINRIEVLCRQGPYAAWEAQRMMLLRQFFPPDRRVFRGRIVVLRCREFYLLVTNNYIFGSRDWI